MLPVYRHLDSSAISLSILPHLERSEFWFSCAAISRLTLPLSQNSMATSLQLPNDRSSLLVVMLTD
jgi:hypothetical protein